MSEEEHGHEGEFGPVIPFWIDTDAYTDRDRHMFVYGFEFSTITNHIRFNDDELSTTIHRENESRVRLACGRFGRQCTIEPCEAKHDPDGTWSYLKIESRR